MNVRQFKDFIIVPNMMALGLSSSSATVLLLGTCAQESDMGKYIVQQKIGYKGGIGVFQMQKNAYDDVWDRAIASSVTMRAKVRLLLGYEGKPPAERMASDLALASVMARLYYWLVKEPLPTSTNIEAMARYWKQYYNTSLGAGTEKEFMESYARFVEQDL